MCTENVHVLYILDSLHFLKNPFFYKYSAVDSFYCTHIYGIVNEEERRKMKGEKR